jgi:hypothetical protein
MVSIRNVTAGFPPNIIYVNFEKILNLIKQKSSIVVS